MVVLPSSSFFDFVPPPAGSEARRSDLTAYDWSQRLSEARSASLTNTPQVAARQFTRRRWLNDDGSELTPDEQLKGFYARKNLIPKLDRMPRAEKYTSPATAVDELVRVSFEMRFSSVRVRAESRSSRFRRQYMTGKSDSDGLVWPKDDEAALACRARLERMAAAKQRKVREFSFKSRLRLQSVAAELDAIGEHSDIMLTLTYPGRWQDVCTSGTQAKHHLRTYRKRLTRYMRLFGLKPSVLWFLEFQLRGAPHFHLILFGPGLQNLDIKDLRRWSRQAWSDVVAHSCSRERAKHLRRGSHASFMKKRHFGYAAKYASKAKQKEVPDGFRDVGRFWGLWNFKLPPPYCPVLEVPMRHLQGLSMALVLAIKDKSIPYANKISARFETHTLREFRNLSASAVVFGTKSFANVCDWIDTCRRDEGSYLLVG